MRLSELLKVPGLDPALDTDVTGITADSREVKPGNLFAALSGTDADGWSYAQSAIEKGAIAILASAEHGRENVPVYCHAVSNPRQELARLADRFEGVKPAVAAAVTGTNGKTSVAHFTRQIWQQMGVAAASIGTLGLVTDEGTEYLNYTTPNPVLLHKILHQLKDAKIDRVVLEASSHGLDQRRVDSAGISIAAFTNFTRDHMDYHSGAEAYLQAKLGLVTRVIQDGGTAVLNADSDVFDRFKDAANARNLTVITYGHAGADLRLVKSKSHAHGQLVKLEVYGRDVCLDLPLAGEFQAMNVLCALGIVIAAGGDVTAALGTLTKLESVPGRMELAAKLPNGAGVYVDFAHTPDALETVLRAVRPHTDNRVITVFGCGGDRDKGKRPEMGKIAATLSDIAIVTDDNPRTEDASVIRAEVKAACPDALEIGDRRDAIRRAIELSKSGDIIVVAGKGHESGQIIGDRVIPFDDRIVVRELASEREVS